MNKYVVGDIIQTRFFYVGSYLKNSYQKGEIEEISTDNYFVTFDGKTTRRINKKVFEKFSNKFDPGSGPPRKFKFLT